MSMCALVGGENTVSRVGSRGPGLTSGTGTVASGGVPTDDCVNGQ